MSGSPQWSLGLTTPLGADALLLQRLEGDERLSDPFLFHLTASASGPVDPDALLGKPACVTLIDGAGDKRYLSRKRKCHIFPFKDIVPNSIASRSSDSYIHIRYQTRRSP